MNKIYLLFYLFLIPLTCKSQNPCKNIQTSFNNYNQALSAVKSADFIYVDNVTTERSSWIRGAKFYSCNKSTGFLIIKTDKREFIHQNVPISVWNNFKLSDSFGSFYSRNIRRNYKIFIK